MCDEESDQAERGHSTQLFGIADSKQLRVWQKADKSCRQHPRNQRDNFSKAAASIDILDPGQHCRGKFEAQRSGFARYVRIAPGSSTESVNHLILMHDLELLDDSCFTSLNSKLDAVGRMLSGLEKRLSFSV